MNPKVVLSKRFFGAPITVSVTGEGVSATMTMESFIHALARQALPLLAEDASRNAGSPALLMTSAQLAAKIKASMSAEDVMASLASSADLVIQGMKEATVVAE